MDVGDDMVASGNKTLGECVRAVLNIRSFDIAEEVADVAQ